MQAPRKELFCSSYDGEHVKPLISVSLTKVGWIKILVVHAPHEMFIKAIDIIAAEKNDK